MNRPLLPLLRTLLIIVGIGIIQSCKTSSEPHSPGSISRSQKAPKPFRILKKQSAELLNHSELVTLLREYGTDHPAAEKANQLFSTPFIDNSFYEKNGIPSIQSHAPFDQALRFSTWNIEKSIHVADAANALASEEAFLSDLKTKILKKDKKRQAALRQRAMLAASDILLSQEMDIGHCRSDYLFAAKHLAKKLGMNFVYAPQQLEVDPVYLGVNGDEYGNQYLVTPPCEKTPEDRAKYKGVFGVTVMSRFPIKHVEVFPLQNQFYDWHTNETPKPDFLERTRRLGTKAIFDFTPSREIKVGGRGFTDTFSTPRSLGPIGKDRLDWIFVKSFLTDPKDPNGPYQLAPHFGETLSLINKYVEQPYSDHHPITTLLPLEEPALPIKEN